MTNDALIKEAREQLEAWNYKGHLDDWRGAESGLCSVIDRLLNALTAANAREAALRKELQAYKDEELRSESGEWLCDRCRQWQAMNAPNLGIECDMCEACADEVDALGGDA